MLTTILNTPKTQKPIIMQREFWQHSTWWRLNDWLKSIYNSQVELVVVYAFFGNGYRSIYLHDLVDNEMLVREYIMAQEIAVNVLEYKD